MKKSELKQIIKEELRKVLREDEWLNVHKFDPEGESVAVAGENGSVTFGTVWDENDAMLDTISIQSDCNTPEGYVIIKIADMKKAFEELKRMQPLNL